MKISLIISRFKESQNEIQELIDNFKPLNPKVYLYNKSEEDIEIKYDNIIIEKIDNVGRESHTYIYHMIKYYDSLEDVLYFIPGSWKTKMGMQNHAPGYIFRSIRKFEIIKSLKGNMEENFILNGWIGSHNENNKFTPKQIYKQSEIRPYKRWFDERIKSKIDIPYFLSDNQNGCLGFVQTTKDKILKINIEILKDWLNELIEYGPNSEIPHFWERSWASIFGTL